MEKLQIEKTPKGILYHVCYVMEQLKVRKINVDEAKAHASLCKQANNVFKHELDKARMIKVLEVNLPEYV